MRTRRCAAVTRLAISSSMARPHPGENMTRTAAGSPPKTSETEPVVMSPVFSKFCFSQSSPKSLRVECCEWRRFHFENVVLHQSEGVVRQVERTGPD